MMGEESASDDIISDLESQLLESIQSNEGFGLGSSGSIRPCLWKGERSKKNGKRMHGI